MTMKVEIEGKYGGPRLRDGLLVAFFKRAPFGEWAAEVAAAFELWREATPDEAKSYSLIGANATEEKAATATTVKRCLSQINPKKAAARELSAFVLQGPQETNPDFMFSTVGAAELDGDEASVVEMRFPTDWAGEDGGRLREFTTNVANVLSFDSGYASLALHYSTDSELIAAARDVPPLAFRHLGFDVHDLGATRFGLGDRCMGARWFTLLGPALVEELGGREAIEGALDEVTVHETGAGLGLLCPGAPRAGDVNRDDEIPELREIARLVEPVTHFADRLRLFRGEEGEYERWQRRFLDDE